MAKTISDLIRYSVKVNKFVGTSREMALNGHAPLGNKPFIVTVGNSYRLSGYYNYSTRSDIAIHGKVVAKCLTYDSYAQDYIFSVQCTFCDRGAPSIGQTVRVKNKKYIHLC